MAFHSSVVDSSLVQIGRVTCIRFHKRKKVPKRYAQYLTLNWSVRALYRILLLRIWEAN